MSRLDSNNVSSASCHPHSEIPAAHETLFLLSISRDDDDAAALRADLKRSTLGNYKIQQCAHLDDALHLLKVCGFDLIFIRLDDYQDKQAAIDRIKASDAEQCIVALATSRLLASPTFRLPQGLDATCRVEDLSPSLVSSLVINAVGQKRAQRQQRRLQRELQLALEAGKFGRWRLDVDTGMLSLDQAASLALGLTNSETSLPLEEALDRVYPEDQARLKRSISNSIESRDPLHAEARLASDSVPLPRVSLSGLHSEPGTRHAHELFGVVKRVLPAADTRDRISKAEEAIRKALNARDEAILQVRQELRSIAMELNPPETSLAAETCSPPPRVKRHDTQPFPPLPAKAAPAAKLAPEPIAAVPSPVFDGEAAAPAISPETASETAAPYLAINKQAAFQNVLKSLARQQLEGEAQTLQDTFPFDFSAETRADYSEPNPHREGFVGAAKRLVGITQKGHRLRVSLNIEENAAIESEHERDLLFEILRELLTNVAKHARASECIIALFRDEDDWVLQVEDDGVGLENNLVSISSPLNQIGLFRIRTKLALKGGQLDLTPTLPRGLIARARLPVNLARNQGRGPEKDAERA